MKKAETALKRTLKVLYGSEVVVAIIILVMLVVLTFGGAVMRYGFNHPFTWMEEIQLASMVWLSFLAAPLAFREKGHVSIELLVDLLPLSIQRIMQVLIGIVVYLVLIYLFVRSLDYLQVFVATGRSTPILGIPYTFVFGIAPVSIILMMVSYTTTEFLGAVKNLLARTGEVTT